MAYRRLLGAQVRSQAQYRASLAVDVAGSVLFGVLDIVSVVVLFRVTPTLGGFGFAEVFLMTALASCAFATADLVAMDVATRRVGRVAFGVVMLVLAAANAPVELTPARLALLTVTPIAGAVIFGAVFVATATVAFWWIESGEIANG